MRNSRQQSAVGSWQNAVGRLSRFLLPPASSFLPPASRLLCPASCLLLTAYCLLLAGCTKSLVVPIRVKVGADLDVQKYGTFAVLPFVDKDKRLTAAQLAPLSDTLRDRFDRMGGVTVLPRGTTLDVVSGEELTLEDLEDKDALVEWGKELQVSALVTGIVRYYSVTEPRQRYVDRYSLQLQRFVTDIEQYVARTHYLTLDLTVRDAGTGEVLVKSAMPAPRRHEEVQSVVGYAVREITGSSPILYQLATEPINDFIRRIAPHYETEERILAK